MEMGSSMGSVPAGPAVDISRDATDIPAPVGNRQPTLIRVHLTVREVLGKLDPRSGTTYQYWTFDGKVPGPLIRVMQGDTVELTIENPAKSQMVHAIDLHAVLGPGGGATYSEVLPGESKTFTFVATTPGLFVYHCGTQPVAEHIANGMFGMILVEPKGGLPPVAHEFYIMQSELYTTKPKGDIAHQEFSNANMMDERPQYFVFNGAANVFTGDHSMQAKVGDKVRIFFGDAGPNFYSSPHIIGQIFTRVYQYGSLTSPPFTDVQTAMVPPGDSAMLELTLQEPGTYHLMDHSMSRMMKGLVADLEVSGTPNNTLIHAGPADAAADRSSK